MISWITKSFRRLGLLFLTAAVFAPAAKGQMGLHLNFLPGQIAAQAYQPAYLADHGFESFSLGLDGAYWLGSNSFRVDGLLREGNYLTEEVKTQILGDLNDAENRLQQGIHAGFTANFRIKNMVWAVGYRYDASLFGRANDPATLGLILRGNAPYAGQTIADSSVRYREYGFSSIMAGTAFKLGESWRLGIRTRLLLGHRANIVDNLNYSLFTESDGSRIVVRSDYEWYDTTTPGQLDGIGAGFDLGLVYRPSSRLEVQTAIRNLGFVSWQGRIRANEVTFAYLGFDIDSIIGNDREAGSSVADSLTNLFFPGSEEGRYTTSLPTVAMLGAAYELSPRDRLSAGLYMGLTQYGPNTPQPLFNLNYHRRIGNRLTLGANAYVGGMEGYGAGLLAAAEFPLGQRGRINFFYSLDNMLGFFAARGISMNGGLGLRY